jgi:hypothetical protein
MVELIEQSHLAIEELIDTVGRVTLQTVLEMSAAQIAGPPQQGKLRAGEIVWHGKQGGSVYLKERKLKVLRPRLRQRGAGEGKEVGLPAYEAMQDRAGMGARMLEILLHGVSTRHYQTVLPAMADTAGVSKSQRQPGSDRSLGSGAGAVAEPAFRGPGDSHHLHRWHSLRGAMRAGGGGCG